MFQTTMVTANAAAYDLSKEDIWFGHNDQLGNIMNWLPRWLGEAYSRLWASQGQDAFDVDTAAKVIQKSSTSTRTILSRLENSGFVIRVSHGVYMLLDPQYVVAEAADAAGLGSLRGTAYEDMLRGLMSCLFRHFGERLLSVIVFGSVARGTPSLNSDIDVLVVVKDWDKSVLERAEEVAGVEAHLSPLRNKLWLKHGMLAPIQFLTLDSADADRMRPLYLDMSVDGIILFDRNQFMRSVLERLKKRLEELGARRVQLPDQSWYWVLKPGLKMGEVVEI